MQEFSNEAIIAAPVSATVFDALKDVLGEEFRQRVKVYSDTPKGLLRNGKLMLSAGSVQVVSIYGDLTPRTIGEIKDAVFRRLEEVRTLQHAPVRLNFYVKERFVESNDGVSARGAEELLQSFTFRK